MNVIEEVGTSYYRAGVHTSNILLEREEFFHIPFRLRDLVDNQRFSIQGFPCLYLGTYVYTCWRELGCPPMDNFQVCRVEADKDLLVYDYSILDVQKAYDSDSLPVLWFISNWPFIAASMVKVKNRNARFKPEYIIPQLLLQYVREDEDLEGLKYSSTHFSSEVHKSGSKVQNSVFPAKGPIDKKSQFCEHLLLAFKITEPISSATLNMSQASSTVLYRIEETAKFDLERMPNFDLIPGKNGPYHSSIFGKIERFLDNQPASKINWRIGFQKVNNKSRSIVPGVLLNKTAYKSLKREGSRILKNDSLRKAIADKYKVQNKFLELFNTNEFNGQFQDQREINRKYLRKFSIFNYLEPVNYEKLRKEEEYINYLHNRLGFLETSIGLYKEHIEKNHNLIAAIERELKKRGYKPATNP